MSDDRHSSAASAENVTSTALLDGVQENDPLAWSRLVNLYGGLVYYWVRRQGLSSEDAADISQEVFRAVARTIQSFRRNGSSGSFRAWLWTITRNKIRDHQRRRVRHPEAFGGTEAQLRLDQVPENGPATSIQAGQTSGTFLRAVDAVRVHFESRTWQAFWMTTIDERPPADVADELGMKVSAVYMAKSRVLRRLRDDFRGLID